jgi:Tol biopolymer transport system component
MHPDFLAALWIFDLEEGTEAQLVPDFEKAGVGGVSIGPNGFVYFAGRESEKIPVPLVLYKIRCDGTGLKQLTEQNAADVAVSEDGSLVAFLHLVPEGLPGTDEPNHTEAWVVGVDGSNPHPVYTGGGAMGVGSIHDPELSPDNKRVAFSRVNPDFKNWPDNPNANTAHDLWVVNVDGTGLTRITKPGPISIVPSWNGDWLVFLELNEKEDYRGPALIKADGTGYKKIKQNAGMPKWMPPYKGGKSGTGPK